jgi:hypothetical protein
MAGLCEVPPREREAGRHRALPALARQVLLTGADSTHGSPEGLLLDLIYTGKAWVGLIDLIRSGFIQPDETAVFIHTGGTPALFPYRYQLMSHLEG